MRINQEKCVDIISLEKTQTCQNRNDNNLGGCTDWADEISWTSVKLHNYNK